MLINMATEGNGNVIYLVWNIVQHLAFWEMINSIVTATNQEQYPNIVLIASAEILERQGSILPSSFYGQLPNC